ncbi:hypothetical protein Vafri_1785, partial [Volvox africanus]
DAGSGDASHRAATPPLEDSSIMADSDVSVAGAGGTAQASPLASRGPYESTFLLLRERRLPISDRILESPSQRKTRGVSPLAPRQPQCDMDERPSGLAAAASAAAGSCQLSGVEVQVSNAQSMCLLPSLSSGRHLHPSGSTEAAGGGTSGGAVASTTAPVADALELGRGQEVLSRDADCDRDFVQLPTVEMSSLLERSRSNLNCLSSGVVRDATNIMPGPPGETVTILASAAAGATDEGGDGDGAVSSGSCPTADAPWALLAARQLGRFVSRVAATVGVGSSLPVAPSDGRRSIVARDSGALTVLHRTASSNSRICGRISGGCGPLGAATEMAACLDDLRQQGAGLPEATSPVSPSPGLSFGASTYKRSRVLSATVFQSLGIGMRRGIRGRSGTSIGQSSGLGGGAAVQLSCASFCNAAGVSIARGPLVQLLTARRAGMSPLHASSTAVSTADTAAATATATATEDPTWAQRDMNIGDTSAMAAAVAAAGVRPRSGSRPRRRSHSNAAQRRWASVNTLSTSTWQVAFGSSGPTAPPVYGHLMVSEARSRTSPAGGEITKSPNSGVTVGGTAEASQLQPTKGGVDGAIATATIASSATVTTAAADLDTSVPTPSTSECCLADAAGSGCEPAQSSSPAKGGKGVVQPPSSAVLDLNPYEMSAVATADVVDAAAATSPPPQNPRPISRSGDPWVASAIAAAAASRTKAPTGRDVATDKVRPLSGDSQAGMGAGGAGAHGRFSRRGGGRGGTGSGYGGNGASSPPILVPRGQVLIAYNSYCSDASRDSRAQSFESNLNAAFASNTSMADRTRAHDASVAQLAISPSRLGGGGAGIGGGSTVTSAALSSRVVTFAASLRTAPKTCSAVSGTAGVTSRAKSDLRMPRQYTGGSGTTFMASSLSRASFSQPGPRHSNVFSSAVDRSAFWTVRYTNGDSSVSDEALYGIEPGADEPESTFGGNSHQRRFVASCCNSGGSGAGGAGSGGTAVTARDKVSRLRGVSERASTLIRSVGAYRRIASQRTCATRLGMAAGSTAAAAAAAAAETKPATKAAAVAGKVQYVNEEIQAYEEDAMPTVSVGLTDAEVVVTAGLSPVGPTHDSAGQKRKPHGQGSFLLERASGAVLGTQHRVRSSLMSPDTEDSETTVKARVSMTTAEANFTGAGAGAGAGAGVASEAESSSECWHEVVAVGIVDPASGRRGVVVMQRDVTAKVVAERHVAQVSETEHRLLEQIFPRHVLQYIMEESGVCSASAEEASAAELDADLDRNHVSRSPTAPLDAASIARWRPHVRDCNRLAVWHPQVTVLFADIQGK